MERLLDGARVVSARVLLLESRSAGLLILGLL